MKNEWSCLKKTHRNKMISRCIELREKQKI